jgi:hypothetical protein
MNRRGLDRAFPSGGAWQYIAILQPARLRDIPSLFGCESRRCLSSAEYCAHSWATSSASPAARTRGCALRWGYSSVAYGSSFLAGVLHGQKPLHEPLPRGEQRVCKRSGCLGGEPAAGRGASEAGRKATQKRAEGGALSLTPRPRRKRSFKKNEVARSARIASATWLLRRDGSRVAETCHTLPFPRRKNE